MTEQHCEDELLLSRSEGELAAIFQHLERAEDGKLLPRRAGVASLVV